LHIRASGGIYGQPGPGVPQSRPIGVENNERKKRRLQMGRALLLWLLGVPIPIIIILALIWH
jgi:hypothetical protein